MTTGWGVEGTHQCHVPQRHWSASFLCLGQIVNTLRFAGWTGSVASTPLNCASVAQDQLPTTGQQMNMKAFQGNFIYEH